MVTQIKLRRDTAANWTLNSNVILAEGEPGFEIDTGKLKIGDGVTDWQGLNYLTGGANTGNFTFDNSTISTPPGVDTISQGVITLAPGAHTNPVLLDYGQFLNIYPTNLNDAPHIHIAAGQGVNGKGDLILGDDSQYIAVKNDGSIQIATHDAVRNSTSIWNMGTDGLLTGPSMGGLYVSNTIIGQYGLTLSAANTINNTRTVRFLDADGTAKSVYTIDYGIYDIGSMNDGNPNILYKTLWWAPGASITIISAVASNSPTTLTITLADPVTLLADTDYTIDWTSSNPQVVTINTDSAYYSFGPDGVLSLPNQGGVYQNNVSTKVTTPYTSLLSPQVIWSSIHSSMSLIKLTICVEGFEDSDLQWWHTQSCEAMIAARGSKAADEPVMSVYAVVYTGTAPLATFSVRRNSTSGLIEVLSTPTNTNDRQLNFRIESKQFNTRD